MTIRLIGIINFETFLISPLLLLPKLKFLRHLRAIKVVIV
jgi:hypothetical protein